MAHIIKQNGVNGDTQDMSEYDDGPEKIMMTPVKKTAQSTTIRVERIPDNKEVNSSKIVHTGGGEHSGIVIAKQSNGTENTDNNISPHLRVEFKVYLVNNQTKSHTQESRKLRFWFKPRVSEEEHTTIGQDFFKEIVSPMEFPRDYVGFIKKIMKLMQNRYPQLKRIEVELSQLEQIDQAPSRPTMPGGILYTIGRPWADHILDTASMEDSIVSNKTELCQDKLLEAIESSYPNPLSIKELAKLGSADDDVQFEVEQLESKGLVRAVDSNAGRCYLRVTSHEADVKIVRQMPTVISSQQPTIAIITAQFCEKLAVDAMIENKDTYVRYTTVGESNVYTLGNIGVHRVVSTKLPTVGHTRAAMIAAGNTTTRLLGSFQKVEYVFLVGCGGGVPHFTDYSRHVRLGDVVVSHPPPNRSYVYAYCDQVRRMEKGGYMFEAKTWTPSNMILQQIARQLWEMGENNPEECPWDTYIKNGLKELDGQESLFQRPSKDTDRLYMPVGGTDIIEMEHPLPPDGLVNGHKSGVSRIHFGPIGAGRQIVKDPEIRQEFSRLYGCLAFDTEFDAVVESIFGNRKDSYMFIRGISDYRDGMRKKEWQPYSSLVAAAFMKSIICALPLPEDE